MKPQLSQLLNKHSIKDMLSAASVLTSVTGSMIKGDENNVTANPDVANIRASGLSIAVRCFHTRWRTLAISILTRKRNVRNSSPR